MKKLNKNNPFKTPEAYFEGFNNRLMNRIYKETSNIPKKDGFGVPKKYFEDVPTTIQQKLEADKTRVLQLYPYRKYYAIAASVAAVIVLVISLGLYQKKKQELTNLNDLTLNTIEDYILDDEDAIFLFDLADELVLNEDIYEDIYYDVEAIEIETFLEKELDNLNFEDYEND